MTIDPPAYDVNPDDLDEEVTPTGAWTLGEILDPDTIDRLEKIARSTD